MTPLELFIVLVALAFVGGVRAARESGSIWGFASGIEYVALGVVLGPHLLGVVTRAAASEFEALWVMALGWLLAVQGANYRTDGGLERPKWSLLGSIFSSAVCCAVVFASVWFTARALRLEDELSLSLGLAAVCTESSFGRRTATDSDEPPDEPQLVRWTHGTALVPIVVLACMTIGAPELPSWLPPYLTGLTLSLVLGFVLGAIVTALISIHFEEAELWPLLLGSVLLVVGTALRLDLPAVTPAFVLGLTVGVLSRHRDDVRLLVNGTDRQVLLPCLLLAGVALEWPRTSKQWLVIGAALLARWVYKLLLAFVVGSGQSARDRLTLGRGLMRGSSVSILIGLVIFLRQSDDLGRNVLVAAALSLAMGEVIGPRKSSSKRSDAPPPDPDIQHAKAVPSGLARDIS